ncbi:MAG: hotdog fold thioesterase [Chloroflexota bacterium]|jgi:uncharacterized protein (TIGR00369 family)
MNLNPESREDKATISDILQAFAVMRANGFHFYRSFMSVLSLDDTEAVCGATMPVRHGVLGPSGTVAAGALGTLADEALANALFRAVAEPVRMATTGLTVQLLRETRARQIRAESEVVSLSRRIGVARCEMTDEQGALVATATGTYAIRRVRADDPRPFASQGDTTNQLQPRPLALHDLKGQELEILKHVEGYLGAPGQDGPLADYLGIEWRKRGDGESSGRWPLGPHIRNSWGVVHGGAMFGALAVAALACIPGDPAGRILEQHVQFVRPGQGNQLYVESHLLRQGQSVIFVQATAKDAHQKTIASALVTVKGTQRARTGA